MAPGVIYLESAGECNDLYHHHVGKTQNDPTLSRFQSAATCGAFISASSSRESASGGRDRRRTRRRRGTSGNRASCA
eukprot:6256577-Prymnesium_polylepis.1